MEELRRLIQARDFLAVKKLLADSNESDISEWLDELDKESAIIAFRLLEKDEAADVFSRMESDTQEELISALSDEELGQILEVLFLDDAADLISEMPADVVKRILANTDKSRRAYINELLKYPKDSAGSLMTIEYVSLKENMTVREAFDRIRKTATSRETVYILYVLDDGRHLVGVTSVKDLLLHEMDTLVSDFMERSVISVKTSTDREEVARMFDKYDFLALPVVDNDNRMVGIVTFDDALDVLSEENEEDFAIMSGMKPSEDSYFKTSVWQHTRNRVTWLLILMISAIFTGSIITRYEETFASLPILVSFIPMLMDTGGNCGSQSSTIIIRGMATNEISLKDVFKVWYKEIRIALLAGTILATINGIRIYLQYHNFMLALTVSLTLVVVVVMAKSLGCLLPMGAKYLKMDPAIMASPILTTIVDACSILVFFNVAVWLLHV